MKRKILVITEKLELKEDVIKQLEKDFKIFITDINDYLDIIKDNDILCILFYSNNLDVIKELKKNEVSELIPIIVISNENNSKMVRDYFN